MQSLRARALPMQVFVQVMIAFPRSILDTTNVFEVIGIYGINVVASVDDPSRESVLADWNVQLKLGGPAVGTIPFGSVHCDLETFAADACPRLTTARLHGLVRSLLSPVGTSRRYCGRRCRSRPL
jgi:hypothetical protein